MRIEIEWEEAPGVLDPVLARTWCSLGIEVDGRPVIEFAAAASDSVRHRVRGSAFPLCVWIVTNWWSVLQESAPVEHVMRGARRLLARGPAHEPWARRHGMLFARDGNALPDLLLFRDGEHVQLLWAPDPDSHPAMRRGRFIGAGRAHVPCGAVVECLRNFVTAVLDRLDGSTAPEVEALRDDWRATLQTPPEERIVCEVVAAVGHDPFAVDDEAWEDFSDAADRLSGLPRATRRDLLSSATPQSLRMDTDMVVVAVESVGNALHPVWRAPNATGAAEPAHRVGYSLARALRAALGMTPSAPLSEDTEGLLAGVSVDTLVEPMTGAVSRAGRVDALVASHGTDALRIAVRPAGFSRQRFALCRAIGASLVLPKPGDTRLVTQGSDWTQRACRAFAAEFLAPADGIRELATDARSRLEPSDATPDLDTQALLANHFGADPAVIGWQAWNHAIDLGGW